MPDRCVYSPGSSDERTSRRLPRNQPTRTRYVSFTRFSFPRSLDYTPLARKKKRSSLFSPCASRSDPAYSFLTVRTEIFLRVEYVDYTARSVRTLLNWRAVTEKPFPHQSQIVTESADCPAYAIFWEQGTGKTRATLDTVTHLVRTDKIDAVLVLAPNGVHRVWIEEEVPKWMGKDGVFPVFWTSGKAGTLKHQRMMDDALNAPFPIVAMNFEGFMTDRGSKWAKRYLTERRVFFVIDESTGIKTPGIKRTRRIVAAGQYAPYRRILTGTPVANNPFDIYSQIRFLDKGFWKRNGFPTLSEFKKYFGIFKTGINTERNKTFEYVVGFRHLDELHQLIQPISSRVLKDEVLDLPPKLYAKRFFELTKEQRRVYKEIRDEFLTFLSSGQLVTAPLAITRMLRLHQVTSNYLPSEDGEQPMVSIDKVNPRLRCLEELLQEVSNSTIIWARFRRDIDQIMSKLNYIDSDGEKVVRAVRYDGTTSSDKRVEAIKLFQSGDRQFFVGNPAAAGLGLTLHRARTVIYYNNSFRLLDRLQSEDRAHRIGQVHPVEYVDIVAPGTIDVYILRALRSKVNIAAVITGDSVKEWI